jgi:hypothetical protein
MPRADADPGVRDLEAQQIALTPRNPHDDLSGGGELDAV